MRNESFLPIVLAATGIVVVSTAFTPTEAAAFSFSIEDFTGDNTKVDFWLEDFADGVIIKASIDSTGDYVSGDISGIWFDLDDDALVERVKILDINKTELDSQQAIADVNDLGGGANVKGGSQKLLFDVGFKVGSKPGNDDIEEVTFFVLGDGLTIQNFFNQAFAVRIKSSDGREGSSKLFGYAPDGPPNQSRGWDECGAGDNPIPCKDEDRDKDGDRDKKEDSGKQKGDKSDRTNKQDDRDKDNSKDKKTGQDKGDRENKKGKSKG